MKQLSEDKQLELIKLLAPKKESASSALDAMEQNLSRFEKRHRKAEATVASFWKLPAPSITAQQAATKEYSARDSAIASCGCVSVLGRTALQIIRCYKDHHLRPNNTSYQHDSIAQVTVN